MAYRLIALDLDDTLLTEALTISPRTKASLMAAQERGVVVVLASGRPTAAIRRYAAELELERFGGHIVGFNGAEVTACADDRQLFQQPLTRDEVHEVYRLSREHGLSILSYKGANIVTAEPNPWADTEHRLTGLEVEVAADFLQTMDGPAVKAILLQEPDRIRAALALLTPVLGGRLNLSISKPYFLEVTSKGIDKGRTLERLALGLGLTAADVVAVGDSYNDVSMIEWAGLGVCMANGPEDVRRKADVVTGSNGEDGVAQAVERFLL